MVFSAIKRGREEAPAIEIKCQQQKRKERVEFPNELFEKGVAEGQAREGSEGNKPTSSAVDSNNNNSNNGKQRKQCALTMTIYIYQE